MTPLLEQFLSEGRELVEDASEGLLELERAPEDPQIINRVFRSVHTLKGNSGLFEFGPLTELLHAAEELMVKVREGQIPLDSELVDLLLEAADVVRAFLDEIESAEAIADASAEDGRRLAGALGARLRGGDGGAPAEAAAACDPDELPSWAAEVPAELLAPGPEGAAAQLFEYRPDPTCFFRGEDPLQLVTGVPDTRWRRVLLDPEAPVDDPFQCGLVLRGVSGAPREEVAHALRYVDEVSTLWTAPLASASEVEAPAEAVDRGSAAALVAKQTEVLDAWDGETAPAVAEVLRRCFSALGDAASGAALSALGEAPAKEALLELLRARPAEASAAEPEAPEASASPGAPESAPREASATPSPRVLKVDQAKVDRLMNLIGQLVVAKNGLPYVARRLEAQGDLRASARELKEHAAVMDRISRELQSAIMEVRMLPVSQVFQRFPRLVRDVSRKLDKSIELSMTGEETQADKNVIEALSEPLVHLVRNALDHGVEPPAERAAKGKPRTGYIRLGAHNENESVVIVIEDDGKGIDPDALKSKATRKGLISEEEASRMSDDEARMLIFAAGFSTKDTTSELSGRGVGMDVVRATIEKVGGRVALESEVGVGTRITLSLPLSMAVSHVMTLHAGGQLYGIGMDSVVETVRYPSQAIRRVKDHEAMVLRERLVPLVRLRKLLALPDERHPNDYGEEAVLVLRLGGETVGLVVDELGENIEVLARPLEGLMADLSQYSGSAVLGDGRLLLLLEMKELLRERLGER